MYKVSDTERWLLVDVRLYYCIRIHYVLYTELIIKISLWMSIINALYENLLQSRLPISSTQGDTGEKGGLASSKTYY